MEKWIWGWGDISCEMPLKILRLENTNAQQQSSRSERRLYETMTDSAGGAKVKWARWKMSRLGLLNWNISHDNEMYGIIGAFHRRFRELPKNSL
jgi:hypothetical protein